VVGSESSNDFVGETDDFKRHGLAGEPPKKLARRAPECLLAAHLLVAVRRFATRTERANYFEPCPAHVSMNENQPESKA
jgi:hypothetical protein